MKRLRPSPSISRKVSPTHNDQVFSGPKRATLGLRVSYCATVLLYATGFSALNLVLPFMFKDLIEQTTLTNAELWYAFGMSGYSVTKSMVSPFVGYFSDQLGRSDSLVVMFACQGLVTGLMATGTSFQLLCFWRFLQGCFGTCGLLVTAIIPELTDANLSEASDFHAYFINGWGVSRLLGSGLVLCLGGHFGFTVIFAGLLMVASSFVFQFFVRPHMKLKVAEDTKKSSKGFVSAMKQATGYRTVCLIWLLQLMTPKLDMTSLLKKTSASGALAMASMSSWGAAFGTLVTVFSLSSWASQRFGPKCVIAVGCVLSAALTIMIPYSVGNSDHLLSVQVLLSVVEAIWHPVLSSLLDSYSNADSIGAFTGFVHLVKGVSGITSQFLSSLLYEVSLSLPFEARGALLFVEAFLFGR